MIDSFLKKQGYGERQPDPIYAKDGVVYFYRRVPGTDGHQFIVRMWPPITKDNYVVHSVETFEVEMTYETRGQIWATTKYYGLSENDLRKHLSRLESCLKQSLLYMDANPLHYQFAGE